MKTLSKIFALLLLQMSFVTTASANTLLKGTASYEAPLSLNLNASDEKKDTLSRDMLLGTYSVKKVIETDENGNQLLNDDGTVKYYYLVIDNNGNVCDATTAQAMVKFRNKAYRKIILNVALGGGLGAYEGKGKLEGILAGTLTGVLTSVEDIATIFTLNKQLKTLKKTLVAYKKTFTDEGLPIDPSVDLSDVDGIDFTKSEELTKTAADVKAELAASIEDAPDLDSLEI